MRDRDVRNAIQAALASTDAFNGVHVWGLPEDYGSGSSEQAAVWIVPQSSRQEDLWDAAPAGGLVITSRIGLLLVYRASDDPQTRDEGAELLLDTAAERPERPGLRRPDLPADGPDHRLGLAAAGLGGAADSGDVFLPIHRRRLGRIRHHTMSMKSGSEARA